MANLNLLAILIGCALPCLPGCESTASTSQPPARSATLDDPPSFGFDATKMGKSFNGGPVPVGTTPLLLKYSEGFYRPASPNTIPHFKEFHAYFQRVISSVQQNWDKILDQEQLVVPSGTFVTITFVMNSNGEVARVVSHSPVGNSPAIEACVKAVATSGPFNSWSDKMVATLGKEQEMTFEFAYR